MRLLLLRHGRTTAPRGTLVGSRSDPGLDAHGHAQAEAAGRLLQARPLAAVVCSPLRRARETAAAAAPGITPRFDARFEELDWGDITGLTWAEVEQRHPATAAQWLQEGWPHPPGGEDPRALWRRVAGAVLDLHAEHRDGDVLVVCHGGVIRAAVGAARGLGLGEAWRVRTPHAELRVQRATPLAVSRWRAVLEVP
jgi:ribonuclease H / adenosylcobalamin/alpha-ribazole phosphatase